MNIKVEDIIENRNNPRTQSAGVEDLKKSIALNGLLQPIVVREIDADSYEVVAGSRRLRACRELGMDIVECVVVDADDSRAYELATTENIVRENMTAVDEANAVAKLFAQGKGRAEIAAMFGRSARWVEGRRRIAELGGLAMEYLAAGKINLGHAEVLAMSDPKEVERWIQMATWKSPEDLKQAIMNEKPLLDHAPFDAKKACRNCENRSDNQTDLFGDVQCCYCLNRECYEKKVAKKADSIRKDYLKKGYAEAPEEDYSEAMECWGDYLDDDSEDENDRKSIESAKARGEKPVFWVDERTCEHGLSWKFQWEAKREDDNEDKDSWSYKINHMSYDRRDKIRRAASEEEKRIVADKLKGVFGNISTTAKAFVLEIIGCEFKDDEGNTGTYLKHQYEGAANFVDLIAEEIVNYYSGVNKDVREFLEMESREEFERDAAEHIPE